MNKFAHMAAGALVAMAGQAFATVDTVDDDVKVLATRSAQMAHEAIRGRQAEGVTTGNAERFAALVRLDRTFLYGNHTGIAAENGVKVNAALGDHSALNDSVNTCRSAMQEGITTQQRLDFVTACQGKLQELSNFNMLQVDTAALADQRYATANIRTHLGLK